MTEPLLAETSAYLDSLLDRILSVEPPISERLLARSSAAGEPLVARLAAVLDAALPAAALTSGGAACDEEVAPGPEPQECECTCHRDELAARAACALAELRSTAAIEALLSALARADPHEQLHQTLRECVYEIGDPVLEPVLRAHEASSDRETRWTFSSLLSQLEVRDERVLRLLVDDLAVEPWSAAGHLVDYDPGAARRELERRRRSAALPPSAEEAAVIAALEGEFRPWGVLDAEASDARLAGVAHATRPEQARVGRNARCPCGSGRKYKKCCLR